MTKFQKRIYEYEFIPGQGIVVVRGELLQFVKENKVKSNEKCTLLFERLVQQQGDVRLTQLEQEYMAKAVGPAKEEVFKQKAQWISGQPGDIKISEMTHKQVKITWKRPTVHPDAAQNYEVQRKEEGNEWISSDLTSKLFQVVTGLKPNVKCHLRVCGVNSHNKGEWSEELTVTTPPGKPNKKKLEEAASHARKQIEYQQTVLNEATQQEAEEAEEIQTPASCNQLQLQSLPIYDKGKLSQLFCL